MRSKRACIAVLLLLLHILATSSAKDNLLLMPTLDPDTNLTQLLLEIESQHPFDTLFVLREHDEDCLRQDYLRYLEIPRLELGFDQRIYLKGIFNSRILALVCLNFAVDSELIAKLAENLQHIRSTHILFVWKQTREELGHNYMGHIRQLVQYCQEYDMYHIIVVFRDFAIDHKYYSYHLFPELKVESRSLVNTTETIFPTRLKDIYGSSIKTASDWIEPRTMYIVDKAGNSRIMGYISHLVQTFMKKINATMVIPTYNLDSLYARDLLRLTRNKTIDFATSLSSPKIEGNTHEFTYPIEIIDWMVMIPNAPNVPVSQIYFRIIDGPTILILLLLIIFMATILIVSSRGWNFRRPFAFNWLDLLLNDKSLRAILGQAFVMPQQDTVKIQICLFFTIYAGFIVSNMYCAYLTTFLVHIPTEELIDDYAQLAETSTKILLAKQEVPDMIFVKGEQFWEKYSGCFKIIDSYKETVRLRRDMNTSYAYGVSSSLWPVIESQQNYFQRRLFRAPDDLFFDDFDIVAIPIQENSIYKEELNLFISQMKASGLMEYWFSSTFIDMWANGFLSINDISVPHVFDDMDLSDMFWIWMTYFLLHFLSLLCFILEHLEYKWKLRQLKKTQFQRIKRKLRAVRCIRYGYAQKI